MKKLSIFICLLILPINVYAKKYEVKLDKCIDGDTVSIIKDKETYKVRFLAVDAPEIDKEEPYSTEAKEFTCNILKKAKHIYLEEDENSDAKDKYDRLLRWVWADKVLVQKELVENGYAKVAYVYGNYKYIDDLKSFEATAKENKINIWSNYTKTESVKKNKIKKKSKKDIILNRLNMSYEYIALLIAAILALLTFYKKYKK